MQNSEYWKLRFEQLEQAQNGQGAAAFAEIERQYKEAQKQIEGQIARWYQRFADNNGITLSQARQYLKGAALKEFQWDVQDYIKYGQDNALMGGWMKELENASAKYHISKLEALKIQTQQSLEVMFSKQLGTIIPHTNFKRGSISVGILQGWINRRLKRCFPNRGRLMGKTFLKGFGRIRKS